MKKGVAFGEMGKWVKAPDGATPVGRLSLQKLPCPARTAVHFLAEPPQKIDEKMSAFKN